MHTSDYFLIGKSTNGVLIKYNYENMVIMIPKNKSIDCSVLFLVHVFDETGKYQKRDFYLKNIPYRDEGDYYLVTIFRIGKTKRVDVGQWNGERTIWREECIVPKCIYFHMDHFAALYRLIAIRYKYYPNDNCYLIFSLVDDDENEKFLFFLEKIGVFSKVIKLFPRSHRMMKYDDVNRINNELMVYFDSLESFLNPSLCLSDEIYCAFDDTGLFALWLDYKGITHTYVEMAKDAFRLHWRERILVENGSASETFQRLVNEKGIINGNAKSCKKWIVSDDTAKIRKSYSKPVEIIDFDYSMKRIPESVVESILNYARISVDELKECDCMITANSKWAFINDMGEQWNQESAHARIYASMLDLFRIDLKKSHNVFFKSHPMYNISFDKYVPRIKCIPKYISTDVLNAIKEVHIDKCMSIKSTAVEKMESFVSEFINVTRDYVYNLEDIFLIAFICSFTDGNINMYGYDSDFEKICNDYFRNSFDVKKQHLDVIISNKDVPFDDTKDKCIFMIDDDSRNNNFKYELVSSIIPKRRELYDNTKTKKVHVYCGNNCIIKECDYIFPMLASGIDMRFRLKQR